MITLIIGGAGSGKSGYAERLLQHSRGPRYYLATMQVWDEECRLRVERHRKMRAGKGFCTVEVPFHLEKVSLPGSGSILLEDLSNLLANERYDPQGAGNEAEETVYQGICALHTQDRHLILVGNEIFCDGADYDGETLQFLKALTMLHRRLAADAENLCEVVAGVPFYYKGKEPL